MGLFLFCGEMFCEGLIDWNNCNDIGFTLI